MVFNIKRGTLKFKVDEGVPELARLCVGESAGVFGVLCIGAWGVVDKFEDIFIPEDLIFYILLVSKCSYQASVLTYC
jgi:hypothetical protein